MIGFSVVLATQRNFSDGKGGAKHRRQTRGELGVPDVSSHSLRKSLATQIDDVGRIPLLGHAQLLIKGVSGISRNTVSNQPKQKC
jgi:integrase